MKKIHYLFLILIIFAYPAAAQSGDTTSVVKQLSVSTQVLGSNTTQLPFWLRANRDGMVAGKQGFLNLTLLNAVIGRRPKKNGNINYTAGTTIVNGFGKQNYLQLNRLFAGVSFMTLQMQAGLFYNPLLFNGLSSCNGNLAKSRNARPYPRVQLSSTEFIPVPLLKKCLSFRFEYDEGILNDNRYVTNTHLHHKSFYLQTKFLKSWKIEVGAEHFVMWGGQSQNKKVGELPSSFNAYLRYIRGASGDEEFLPTDQLNVAGNQYGTYQMLISKELQKARVSINISHPFEDLSGVNLRNWPDNLIGLDIKLKPDTHGRRNQLVNHILYEFTNTRQQSIVDSLYMWNEAEQSWEREENDNYFSHGIYRSGVTYRQLGMVSPLFAPVVITNGISKGFGANRFYSHHIGVSGHLNNDFNWKSLITFTHYLGTYAKPYLPSKEQYSFLFQCEYSGERIPFTVGLSVAADYGTFYNHNLGTQLKITKYW